jgi:hypothetical protein
VTVPLVMIAMFAVGLAGLYARGRPASFGAAAVIATILSIIGTASYLRELILKAQRPARVVVRAEPGRHRR